MSGGEVERVLCGLVLATLPLAGCATASKKQSTWVAAEAVGRPEVGVDRKWIAHSNYLEGLIGRVMKQWESLLVQNRLPAPSASSSVVVKFVLTHEGRISRIVSVEGAAGDLGIRAAVSAVTNGAPYTPWSEEMQAALGREQEMTFTFLYQ